MRGVGILVLMVYGVLMTVFIAPRSWVSCNLACNLAAGMFDGLQHRNVVATASDTTTPTLPIAKPVDQNRVKHGEEPATRLMAVAKLFADLDRKGTTHSAKKGASVKFSVDDNSNLESHRGKLLTLRSLFEHLIQANNTWTVKLGGTTHTDSATNGLETQSEVGSHVIKFTKTPLALQHYVNGKLVHLQKRTPKATDDPQVHWVVAKDLQFRALGACARSYFVMHVRI